MSTRCKRCVLLSALVAMVLVVILSSRSNSPATASAVEMTFVGYTNPPGNGLRFALFSVSNRTTRAIRWRDSGWVEIEGSQEHKGVTVNPSLPGYPGSYGPVLKGGASLTLAVGEPSDNKRWRFAMSLSRYSWEERWFDFSFRHRWLPVKLGPVTLVDTDRILSRSNFVTVSTAWLPL
jgi:hypothetical protein